MAQSRICMAADVSALAMTPDIGAEIRGVDLTAPMSDACFNRIMEIYTRYCVVFFREQRLDPQLLARFAARFGELDAYAVKENQVAGLPQVEILTNVKQEGRVPGGTRAGGHWHSDRSYQAIPASATLLYCAECSPQGANTEFANMYAVFEALPRERRLLLEKLRAVHDREFRSAEREPFMEQPSARPGAVEHPLVRVHPKTGRKALFAAKEVVSHILGMSIGDARKLIEELEAFATQPRFVYSHRWRPGDLLVWDNRCTLHRATSFDTRYDRTLYRVQVKGELPIAA